MSENTKNLLVELGTEELPPKSLKQLSDAFTSHLVSGLSEAKLIGADTEYRSFASPRRLAVYIEDVALNQEDSMVERRGPAVKAAFDDAGNPTPAARGFAGSCKVEVSDLERVQTDKGEWLVYRSMQQGQAAGILVPEIIDAALRKLPIPKRMRWSDLEAEFVRPVHWLVILHGEDVIDTELLSTKSGNHTAGHRFHHPAMLDLATASDYEAVLAESGYVIANYDRRQDMITEQVNRLASEHGGKALLDPGLLNEVTALVEWPVAMVGRFDDAFLDVPQEALISAMQDHQKYFPVVDQAGKMKPLFIFVSNIDSSHPASVTDGNERVLNARFSDARFFWETDRQDKLESLAGRLKSVVFHNKLGSVHDRALRVSQLAGEIAVLLGTDRKMAERAALLAKADLLSGMVSEFPDLQGTMGRYYALEQGEDEEIATAIQEQYLPRFAGDDLPVSATGRVLSIADKLDTLFGIFSIGEVPTGDKDPFALRRAALGVLRIMIELDIDLDLYQLLDLAAKGYKADPESTNRIVEQVFTYMLDRLQAYYLDKGYSSRQISSVLQRRPTRPSDFNARLHAVDAFGKLDEAPSLAAANKRIQNILRKSDLQTEVRLEPSLFREEAERALYEKMTELSNEVDGLFIEGDYTLALSRLATLRTVVDNFFDQVMVNDENPDLRANRLALLEQLGEMFLRTADLSQLQ
jgi:glycyl-tRNA synthetase beta chain